MGYIQREIDMLSEKDLERIKPFKDAIKKVQHHVSKINSGGIEDEKTKALLLETMESLIYRTPMTEVTDDEIDWIEIRFHGGATGRFQHRRDPSLFKFRDGKTYYRAINYKFQGRHIPATALKNAHDWIEVELPCMLKQFDVDLHGTEGHFEICNVDLLDVEEFYDIDLLDNDKPLRTTTIAEHGEVRMIEE
jgi:hypothetical protein